MTEQFPKRTGVFPWTRLPEEDLYMGPATDLKNRLDGIYSKWIILSTPTNASSVESFDFLQRALTCFITYYASNHFRFDHALWFGADNLPTMLHYVNELAKLRNIKTSECKDNKGMTPKDSKRLFGEILNNLNSTSSFQKKVLCIFSGPEYYENKSGSSELWPFMPSDTALNELGRLNITFLVVTSSPQNWSDSKFCHINLPPINFDFQNLFISPWSRVVATMEDPSVLQVMSMIAILYPDNFSSAFVQGLLESRWPNDSKFAHYKWFVELKILREIKATNPKNTCLDRSFQRYLWATLPENFLQDSAASLNNFINQIFQQLQSSQSGPFAGLVIEAGMHQLWLQHFLVNAGHSPIETNVANQVIEYLQLKKIGKIVMDKREILGEGAFSTVFSGQIIDSPEIARNVAVKRVPIDVKHLYRETNTLAQIDPKDRLVRYILREDDPWNAYIALELCDQTLKDWVIQQGLVDLNRFEFLSIRIKLLQEVTEGTKYLHEQNILHRDIKPSNILLTSNGSDITAKLSDFGLSKEMREGAASISGRAGTHGYMAPEMTFSGGQCTAMADIYSLGCVFYFVLTCAQSQTSTLHRRIQRLTFDYFGMTETITKMTLKNSDERVSAAQLLGYPMFWYRVPKKYTDFLIQLRMKSGSRGCRLQRALESILLPVDWNSEMTLRYPDFEQLFKRMSRVGPYQNTADSFLRCARNAVVHAQDHKALNLRFVDKYYGTELDHHRFFQIWFQPFPEIFFKAWLVNIDQYGTGMPELDVDTEDDSHQKSPSLPFNLHSSRKLNPNFIARFLDPMLIGSYTPAPGSFLAGTVLGSATTYLLMRCYKS